MNSRLNQEIRDKRGLAYTVDSSIALLSDTGLMQIYFGCDPQAVQNASALSGAKSKGSPPTLSPNGLSPELSTNIAANLL